jgi:hypothetical protein
VDSGLRQANQGGVVTSETELLAGTALEPDRVIPGVALTDAAGESRRLWDFRQRAALAVCFLHARCGSCRRYASALAELRDDLQEVDAIAVAIVQEPISVDIRVFVDRDGGARRRMLGTESGPPLVLIVDRYGAAWRSFPAVGHSFPPPEAVMATLQHLAIQCPECGAPAW